MSADLDKAIDRAVREMLDVEPPAGFRRRVLEAIEKPESRSFVASAFGWKILLPVAAAALLILALLLPRGTPRQPEATVAGVPQPGTAPLTTAPGKPLPPESPAPPVSSHPVPQQRVVAAAVAATADVAFDAPPAPGFPRLPALSVPELTVSSIQRLSPVEGPGALATDPIATPSPLAIEPLSAQGRQSQE